MGTGTICRVIEWMMPKMPGWPLHQTPPGCSPQGRQCQADTRPSQLQHFTGTGNDPKGTSVSQHHPQEVTHLSVLHRNSTGAEGSTGMSFPRYRLEETLLTKLKFSARACCADPTIPLVGRTCSSSEQSHTSREYRGTHLLHPLRSSSSRAPNSTSTSGHEHSSPKLCAAAPARSVLEAGFGRRPREVPQA